MVVEGFAAETLVEGTGMERLRTKSPGRTAEDAATRARLGRTLRGLRSPWVLLEAVLVALSGAVLALWLAIPDRNVAEITLSFAMAMAGIPGFFWAQGVVLAMARRRGGERPARWKGMLLLTGLALSYWLVATIFDVGEMRDVRRAAAWSLEPGVSRVLSADALMAMQGALWWMLRFVLMTALLPFAMEGVATGMRGRWVRRGSWLLLEPLYWSVVLGCAVVATLVTEGMLNLRPQVPLVAEVLLTVLKVMVMFAADVGLLCVALSLSGTFLRDAQMVMAGGTRSKGTPRPPGRSRMLGAPGARSGSGRRRRR